MVPCTFNINEAVLAKQCLNKGECKGGKLKKSSSCFPQSS